MKSRVLFCMMMLSSVFSSAAPASYETQLMKLSKAIKGEPASAQDRQNLSQALSAGKVEEFLNNKSKEYLNDEKFTLKLKQRVDELLRLVPQTTPQSVNQYEIAKIPSAYDHLVQSIISNNLSWDKLLTAKEFMTFPNSFINAEEKYFYERLDKVKVESPDFSEVFLNGGMTNPTLFTFAANDQRVAGILSTPRFLDRYVTTALNKNRRRAAAVFRLFLCETMIPTVPAPDSSSQKNDYDVILPAHQDLTEEQLRRSLKGNVHGQQADCMACHYKLDPLGQTFGFSASTLSPLASPGALRFKGQDGRKVDIPLKGLGDLGEQITLQPEYELCQISHFWRWYIGKDIPLTPVREKELIRVFNQVQRKPKDFIAHLVTLPEFKQKSELLSEDQLLAHRVVKIFKNCNSCHDSEMAFVWDLTSLPYEGDLAQREKAIHDIKKALDIDGDGSRAEMPPKDSLWQLSQDEFTTIKKWIQRGAPDFKGLPQVPPRGAK